MQMLIGVHKFHILWLLKNLASVALVKSISLPQYLQHSLSILEEIAREHCKYLGNVI